MSDTTLFLLDLAEGPLFRVAFSLLVLGLLRAGAFAVADLIGGWLTALDGREFAGKLGWRLLWWFFPARVLRQVFPGQTPGDRIYLSLVGAAATVFRVGVVLVPTFMLAHVYLWERAFGQSWPAWPGPVADGLTLVTMSAGLVAFFGRLYSPLLRRVEPPWAFLKPLLLLLPFVTGYLSMHPTMFSLDYYVLRLAHVLSAELVFVLIPFARLLMPLHPRLVDLLPAVAWRPEAAPAVPQPMAPAARL